MAQQTSEYVLTLVQHAFCTDCALVKNKIAEIYIMSGLNRGEQSKHWRVQILSPPWDRNARRTEFPKGFKSVDVPALKLEVNGRVVATTQAPGDISNILSKLKEMLGKRCDNDQIASEIELMVKSSTSKPEDAVCPVIPDNRQMRR
ncbi:MAG TPA: hypothetical protein VID27_14945 [Blastocatellia bacterium]